MTASLFSQILGRIDTATSADSSRAARAKVTLRRGRLAVAGVLFVVLLGSAAIATPQTFTDETLIAGFTMDKAVHLLELRSDVNALRMQAGLIAFPWSEPLVPQSTIVRAAHMIELRKALDELAQRTGKSSPSYADGTLVAGQSVIRAQDVQDLRNALRAIFLPIIRFANSTSVSGTGIPGATVQVFVNGVARGTPATVNAVGNWTVVNLTLAPTDIVDGSQYILYFPTPAGITVYTSPTVGGPYTLFSGLPNGRLDNIGGQASGFRNAALGQYWDYLSDGPTGVCQAIVSTLDQPFSLPPPAPAGPPPVAMPVIIPATVGLPATTLIQHPKFAPNTP